MRGIGVPKFAKGVAAATCPVLDPGPAFAQQDATTRPEQETGEHGLMNVKKSLVAGGLALAASAATLVVGFAPAASASCVSNNLTTGYRSHGSPATKPSGTT